MIAMSFMRMGSGFSTDVYVEYTAKRPSHTGIGMAPAFFTVGLELKSDQSAGLILSVQDAREIAEELTRLIMAHDAAEHTAHEQAVAVAESPAA
ncbi:hypothetical protein ACIGO9_00025 [Nocardia asteroides]|uniref:hypothetical protein n=1 Tax=Nocardia asteroides TaxID=1824 RepID=UPI0037C8E529